MKKFNILLACEESQVSCISFRNLGANAFSCDLQHSSGGHPEWHIYGDVISLLNGNCHFICEDGSFHSIDKWDLILAHPPCTFLAASSANRMFRGGVIDPVRYDSMLKARDFFYSIWNCNCDHICIENPRPLRIANLPKSSCVVSPFLFGSSFSKRTYLWLKNLPPIIYKCIQPNFVSFTASVSGSYARSKSDPLMYQEICSQFYNFLLSEYEKF